MRFTTRTGNQPEKRCVPSAPVYILRLTNLHFHFSFKLGLTFTLNYQVLTTTANAGGEAKGLHRLRRLVGGGREMSEKRIFFLVTDKVGILILIGVVAVDFWMEG